MPDDGLLNLGRDFREGPDHHGVVDLVDLTVLERRLESSMGLCSARHHKQTTSVLSETI